MNGRERELAALRHECPDRIPVDAICIETIPQIARHLKIPDEAVYERLGIDGRGLWLGYKGPVGVNPDGTNMTPWGTVSDGQSYDTVRPYPLAADDAIAQIERHPWPDPALFDYAAAVERARSLCGRYAVRGPGWTPLFDRVCDLIGMEEAMVKLMAEPDVFEAVLENVFARTLDIFQRMLDATGEAMPIFTMGDDFATQRGMLISPDAWRRLLKPRYARIFAAAKRSGRYVWFHSCGDITPVLGDLIDIGMDLWETVQLHTLPISAQELKRRYGRHIVFFGGVNTQRLPFAGTAEVSDEVRRCIDALGEGGGYICGPDHHIKPDVPAVNTLALFDEATRYRRAGWTL